MYDEIFYYKNFRFKNIKSFYGSIFQNLKNREI
jgi:hypothetical protein